MSNTKQTEKQSVSSHEAIASNHLDSNFNFEQWAGAVRQQMLASLKRREGTRFTLD